MLNLKKKKLIAYQALTIFSTNNFFFFKTSLIITINLINLPEFFGDSLKLTL